MNSIISSFSLGKDISYDVLSWNLHGTETMSRPLSEARAGALTWDPFRATNRLQITNNPPYFAEGSGLPAPEEGRAAARGESRCTLEDLCTRAAGFCRSGGKAFLSYRPERLCELLRQCADVRLEPKRLRLVHHRPSAEASILLLEARKDGKPGLRIEPPLILHDDAGNETEEYKRIYHR